jgi:hypothetical protein
MSVPPANVTNTSNTYGFAPNFGEIILYAYGLCGVRRTALTQQHFDDARMAANLALGRASSDGVNLWQVQLGYIPLVQGCATYPLPYNIVVILDAYYTIGSGSTEIDRIMLPVSRSEYAAYSTKQQQGSPSVFWMDRSLSPTVTLYRVPNGQQVAFKYYYLRQNQDATMSNGGNVEVPQYFLDWFAIAMASRLALIWAPDRAAGLKALADEAWAVAARQNVEQSNIYVTPVVSGYYR